MSLLSPSYSSINRCSLALAIFLAIGCVSSPPVIPPPDLRESQAATPQEEPVSPDETVLEPPPETQAEDLSTVPETEKTCRPIEQAKIVQQGDQQALVMLDVGDSVSDSGTGFALSRKPLSAKDLELADGQSIILVFNPNARSPHFYALVDDGIRWSLRAYCKDPVFVVSEETLRDADEPSTKTAELGDWAFAMQVAEDQILVWNKGDSWRRVKADEKIVDFTLGSVPAGVRVGYLTASGHLGIGISGAASPRKIQLGLGRIDQNQRVEMIDRGSNLYVLTGRKGVIYDGERHQVLYQGKAQGELLWRDPFFSANGRKFGVLLLSKVNDPASIGPKYQGVVISVPEDGPPQESEAMDLSDLLDFPFVDEPRLFVRAQDNALRMLHACLVVKKGETGSNQGLIKPLQISRSSRGTWRVRDRGPEQNCGKLDLDEIHVVGNSGRKDRIVHHLETTNQTCVCSL